MEELLIMGDKTVITHGDDDNAPVTCSTLSAHAIADFIGQHREELTRFIRRRLGSDELAADLLQEAYLRISKSPQSGGIDNLRAYTFRVVANLMIDYQRLEANKSAPDVDGDSDCFEDERQQPENLYLHRQRLDAVEKVIMELPYTCRMAFYLHRIHGLSYAEVAAHLGISEGMVGKHLVAAIKHCRSRLSDAE